MTSKLLAEETPGHDDDQITAAETEALAHGTVEPTEAELWARIPRRTRRRTPKKIVEPKLATPVAHYAWHVVAWLDWKRTQPRDLTWTAPEPESTELVAQDKDGLIGLPVTRRAKFDRKPGHAYHFSTEAEFEAWMIKYGLKAKRQLALEAQRARETKNTRYMTHADKSDFMTRRTIPEIERQVREVLAKDKIELTSWYDPAKREWFKLWEPAPVRIPPMRNLSRERAKAAGLRHESELAMAAARNVRKQLGDATQGELRSIYSDRWDDLHPAKQNATLKAQYDAMVAMMDTMAWHDDLLVARLSLIDKLLKGFEELMYSKSKALVVARYELAELERANDDTEIPIELLDRKEARIEGIQTQLVAFQGFFAQAMRLREQMVAQSPIEWSQYTSIEKRMTERASAARRAAGTLQKVQNHSPEEWEQWKLDNAYEPHWDGADAPDEGVTD